MFTVPMTTDDGDDYSKDNGIGKEEEPSSGKEPTSEPVEITVLPMNTYERVITVLRDGNEIQRISVLRALPTMLANGNNADVDNSSSVDSSELIRVLPEIQETLTSGSAGLELHFEASQAYKDLAEQASRTDPSLCSQILQGVIQNLDAQDSIACSAWLETLLDIISHLPLHMVHNAILPLAVNKAQQLNSVHSRLMASKLMGRLAYKLDPVDVKVQIVPLVQSLCQDIDAGIRASVCQQLSIVAYSLSLGELKSVVLPLAIEFSKDEDEFVREANLETLVSLLSLFDDETCSQILVPLFERFVGEILERKSHKTLLALSKNYGSLFQGLHRVLSFKQKDWFMEKFCDLCQLGAEEEEDDENSNGEFKKLEFIARKYDPQTTFQSCRENAALNFPALAQLAGRDQFKTALLPRFKKLCQDSETDVRRNVASGFHEMVKFMGPEAPALIDSFIDLVYSGEPEVIASLTPNLSLTLEHLYRLANVRSVDDNGNVEDSAPYSHTQLTRILLACNRLIRNCSNWRCHQQYLLAMASVSKCVSKDVLMSSYVPMIKEEIINTRALPCRLAALTTLILWMKDLSSPAQLQNLVDFLTVSLVAHKSCHKRILYLDACQMILEYLPVEFFKKYFFHAAMKLSTDPVLNVRAKLCKLLPTFKRTLTPSIDKELLVELESVVRNFMNDRNNSYMNEILRDAVNKLSNSDDDEKEPSNNNNNNKSIMSKSQSIVIENKSIVTLPTPQAVKSEEKKTAEVAPIVNNSKHPTKSVVHLHQDLDVKAKLPPPVPKPIKNGTANKEEPPPQQQQQPKKTRSPSPPKRTSTTTTNGNAPLPMTMKKTAVIKPRQLMTRSPSPRPPFKEDYLKKPPLSTSSSTGSRSSSISGSSNSSTGTRRSSDISSSSIGRSSASDRYHPSFSSSERFVPIKLVHSSSGSSIRPPTPVSSTYKRQRDRSSLGGASVDSYLPSSRTSSSSTSSSSSLPSSRTIPVVRTGSVLKSVERFETSGNDLNANRPPLRSSAPSSNLGYSKALNRSFSSFSSRGGYGDSNNNSDLSSSKDSGLGSYGSNNSSLRRSSLASSSPMDRSGSYGLTRVRSGSSITAPSSSTYSRLKRT